MPNKASEKKLPYQVLIFVWSILLTPISLAIFVFTSSYASPMAFPGILVLWAAMIGSMVDEDASKINWKQRFEEWIFIPLLATLVQALVFESSLWGSIVFLNAWFLLSHAFAAFVIPLWKEADQKNWKEFRKNLGIFLGGAPVLLLLFLPTMVAVLSSIIDSTTRLGGASQTVQKVLLAMAILGLLLDVRLTALRAVKKGLKIKPSHPPV